MEWISVKDQLPKKGIRVRCKLSSNIAPKTSEKNLYRMKHNGLWNDYNHLVTHWCELPNPPAQ